MKEWNYSRLWKSGVTPGYERMEWLLVSPGWNLSPRRGESFPAPRVNILQQGGIIPKGWGIIIPSRSENNSSRRKKSFLAMIGIMSNDDRNHSHNDDRNYSQWWSFSFPMMRGGRQFAGMSDRGACKTFECCGRGINAQRYAIWVQLVLNEFVQFLLHFRNTGEFGFPGVGEWRVWDGFKVSGVLAKSRRRRHAAGAHAWVVP